MTLKKKSCNPYLYFQRTPGSRKVRLSRLSRDHIPSEEKVAEAVSRMEKAARGEYPKREPITIRKTAGGRYLVVDGNTTTTVMRQWGCSHIIAIEIE